MSTNDRPTRRIETAYLLPVALGKHQLGNWWTAALEEGLLNHGDCLSPVEILMDSAQLRREPQPFNAWRPRGTLTSRIVPSETEPDDAVRFELGSVLGFRQIEGLMLQLHSRFGDEDVTFLAFDARMFDEQREWCDPVARDRLLHLVSRALARVVEPDYLDQLEDQPAPVARRA